MRYNGDVLHVIAVLLAAVLFGTTGTSQALGPDGTTPLAVGVHLPRGPAWASAPRC